jgi:hypothetical protein
MRIQVHFRAHLQMHSFYFALLAWDILRYFCKRNVWSPKMCFRKPSFNSYPFPFEKVSSEQKTVLFIFVQSLAYAFRLFPVTIYKEILTYLAALVV